MTSGFLHLVSLPEADSPLCVMYAVNTHEPPSTSEVCRQHWFQFHENSIRTTWGLQEFQDSWVPPRPTGSEMLGVGLGTFNIPSRGFFACPSVRTPGGHVSSLHCTCFKSFMYFWLCWDFVVARCRGGCSLVVVRQLLVAAASRVSERRLWAHGLSTWLRGSAARRLQSSGPTALVVTQQVGPPQGRARTVFPTLAGRFSTTEPPGKPCVC